MYWIEEVDKELRKNEEELNDLEVSEESIIYCVFYWTSIALHVCFRKYSRTLLFVNHLL